MILKECYMILTTLTIIVTIDISRQLQLLGIFYIIYILYLFIYIYLIIVFERYFIRYDTPEHLNIHRSGVANKTETPEH
jgi:hypothetical protein